jgi:hypothetical protein
MHLYGTHKIKIVWSYIICFNKKKTPWRDFASELYRSIDRRLSAELVPAFADRRVSRNQRGRSPKAVISVFFTGAATFSSE